MHVIACLRYFGVAHIREIERRAVAMTTLGDRVDISASLQVFDILLCTQYRRHIKAIVGQVIALEDVRPFFTDRVQFALGARDEVWHGVGKAVNDIVVVRLNLHQLFAH